MNRKSAWIVLAVALLISLPTRLYQIFFLADKDTGFFTDGGTTTGIISVSLAVGILLVLVFAAREKYTEKAYQPVRSMPTAVLAVLTGLGLAVESAVAMGSENGSNYIMYMILSLFGILTGAVLILTAYDFATGQNHFIRMPLLALLPSLWGCVCLITLFITCVPVVNVSENIYDAFAVIFLLLFLFTQAKLFAGVGDVKSGRLIYFFGLPAILLTLVTGVSGTVMLFAGLNQSGMFPAGLHAVNLLIALYAISFLRDYRKIPEQPLSESVQPENTVVIEPEQPEPPVAKIDWKSCFDFLTKEYESKEIFSERSPSPFIPGKNENC